MKKNFWVLLCTALAMFSMASCSKDETAKDSFETIEATVTVPEQVDAFTGSRTMIYDAADGGIELWWGTSEAIGVYGTRLTNKKFTGTNKYKDAASTSFSGATLFSSPKYAYYPYSADNNSNAQTAVKGYLPATQDYSTVIRRLNYDYKIGTYDTWSWSGSKFYFANIVTFARIQVNATGTALEGDELEKVQLIINTADGQPRQISGEFTFDLTKDASTAITSWTASENSNKMTLALNDTPTLTNGTTVEGFLTVAPTVQVGDMITFVITTNNHIATFSRASKAAFTAAQLIKYPLTLTNFSDMVIEEREQYVEPEPEEGAECVLNSMKFTVANNPGKILARNFTHNSSFTVTVGKDKTEEVATIDEENKKITLYVPYLNNRKLVPTFEIPEGTQLIYEGGEIISGETEVDFATYKQVAVINAVGDAVIYDVELTNTGLPVVVINQQSGLITSSSQDDSDYQKATQAWYDATGTYFQPKDSDWSMEDGDSFMIYNADGTSALKDKNGAEVTEPVLASTRVRGNVSQQMPKKPFAVKLDKKHAVLDMPAHQRWVLLANWKDRTLMRNEVAFEIAKAFKTVYPNDGMAWNPSGQHVELVYNGVYVGNYYLCEQIKIDGNRLDINEPYDAEDNPAAPADCGILMESDDGYDEAWQFTTRCRIPFLFKDDGTADMLTYASTLVQGIEDNLNKNTTAGFTAAYETMDITSFVDFLLVQDLMMNSEMKHPKSCYSYINNGKLYAGPVWDFDWNTLPTSTSYSEEDYSYTESIVSKGSWSYKSSAQSSPSTSDENYIWYPRLMASSEFMDVAKTRWAGVQGQLSQVLAHIDEVKAQIAKSEAENAKMWPVDSKKSFGALRGTKYGIGGSLGMGSGAGFCGDEGMTFDAAVEQMKETLSTRMSGMSNNIYK